MRFERPEILVEFSAMKTSSSMRGRSSVLASPSWDSNGEGGEMTDTQIQEGHRPLFLPL